MADVDVIVFNGIKFIRYPNGKSYAQRNRYRPSGNAKRNGACDLHREIWKFYNGPIPDGYHIHHIDGNPLNNALENLECISEEEHRAKHGGMKACAWCDKPFMDRSMGSAVYCSAACTTAARRASGVDDETRTCTWCGKEYRINKHSKATHCSQSCASYDQWERKRRGE